MTEVRRYQPGDTPDDRRRSWNLTVAIGLGGLVLIGLGFKISSVPLPV